MKKEKTNNVIGSRQSLQTGSLEQNKMYKHRKGHSVLGTINLKQESAEPNAIS